MDSNLFVYASYFHNWSFNVTHIVPLLSDKVYFLGEKSFKSPSITHDIQHLINNKQELSELSAYNWKLATGIGVILGFNSLRAIDIDGCNDLEFVRKIIGLLKLPLDYKWVVKSGSNNGYHILFYADEHNYFIEPNKVRAFRSNLKYHHIYKHIELRWSDHLVLPPSIHFSGNRYEFIYGFPDFKPLKIKIQNLEKMVDEISSTSTEEENDLNYKFDKFIEESLDGISGNHLSFD